MAANPANIQNVSLVGRNKTAVVVGGTSGNGEGIARRLAQIGCSRIIICAHDEAKGKEVLNALKKLAPKDTSPVVQFILGDLSCGRISAPGFPAQLHVQIMSQNGAPTGSIKENPDGHDTTFATQCISRFALAYLLTTRGALAPNAIVMSIYYHWGHSLDDLDVDDLSLKRRVDGQSTTNFYKAQTRRDCTVLDSINEVLILLYLGGSLNNLRDRRNSTCATRNIATTACGQVSFTLHGCNLNAEVALKQVSWPVTSVLEPFLKLQGFSCYWR
ncbi:hypothetical protein K438DRAFT_1760468 [Mycena galopus ATCC 62051]|nr:hypothetical protein K438DRAFT_1760468 [Mycena galopus ATCC 62051]